MTIAQPSPPFDSGTAVDTGTATVRAAIVDHVGVIELNRPERRNALHHEMYDAVPDLIGRFESDDAVRALVISGAGNGFCAGGDVQAGADRARSDNAAERTTGSLAHNARMVLRLRQSPLVSIAALTGPAVGAGLSIALAADLRVAARSARLITGWAPLGFSGDFGGTWLLTRLVGPARALELLVDNVALSADDALGLGLVNRVVDDEQVRGAALDWARSIAGGSRPGLAFMKQNVNDALSMPLDTFLPVESQRMTEAGQTEEHRAAVRRWLAAAKAKRQQTARPDETTMPQTT